MNFKQCNPTNYRKGRLEKIKYIVVHYTANDGDTAKANAVYFTGANLKASAHYFVDENEIWQSVKDTDTAWHCGGGLQGNNGHTYYKICNNSNSIGIEMCSRKNINGYYIKEEVIQRAADLIIELKQKYNIEKVIRHYDVTGKNCPAPLIDKLKWAGFLNRLEEEILTKQEIVEIVNEILEGKDSTPSDWAKDSFLKATKAEITDGKAPKKYTTKEEVIVMMDRSTKL